MTVDAHAADFYRPSRLDGSLEVTDRDIHAVCGQCCFELTLDQAKVEPVGAVTGYGCPGCNRPLLVVAAIPGEHGLVGMRTVHGARAWLAANT